MRLWRKGNPSALLVEMQAGAATVENSMEITQKIKNGSFWPSDPTSENISKGTQNTDSKENKHLYVNCSIHYSQSLFIIYNHQNMERAQMSITRWVDKTTMGYLHNVILPGRKKEVLPLVTAWMEPENTMLSEISQSEKDKYRMISLICGI